MAKQAYFVLLLLVATYGLSKVEAEEVEETGNYAWISSRKFIENRSLLKTMGIDTDAENKKHKCARHREPCNGPDDCCKFCYCKAFGVAPRVTTLCDGKLDCHEPK